MEPPALDEVDRGILHLLQVDARNNSAATIAEAIGVAPNTVRNRIEQLEENGVIEGYHPLIDYEQAGFQLRVVFVCTVPVKERAERADQALEIDGVIEVNEILSGEQNLTVQAVARDSDDLTMIGTALEDLGVSIQDELFLKRSRAQPFNHFGAEALKE